MLEIKEELQGLMGFNLITMADVSPYVAKAPACHRAEDFSSCEIHHRRYFITGRNREKRRGDYPRRGNASYQRAYLLFIRNAFRRTASFLKAKE